MAVTPSVPIGYLTEQQVMTALVNTSKRQSRAVYLRNGLNATRLVRCAFNAEQVYVPQISGAWWAELYDRQVMPYEVAIDGIGVHPVREALLPEQAVRGENGWLLLMLGPLRPLPAHLVFASYDIGHDVVVLSGIRMGEVGRVSDVASDGYILDHTINVPAEDIAVVRGACIDELLVPLRVRLPPGSHVWVRTEQEVAAAVISGYTGVAVDVWVPGAAQEWRVLRSRLDIVERVDGETCPLQPSVPKRRQVPASKNTHRGRSPREWQQLDIETAVGVEITYRIRDQAEPRAVD